LTAENETKNVEVDMLSLLTYLLNVIFHIKMIKSRFCALEVLKKATASQQAAASTYQVSLIAVESDRLRQLR